METKKCNKCKVEKSVKEFSKDNRLKSGLRSWCKGCTAEDRRQRYINSIEESKAYSRQYRKNNPEKVKELNRQWYISNLEYYRQ